VRRYQNAAFVPASSAIVSEPETTWSLIPSFGVAVAGAEPNSRSSFVSFSQKTTSGLPSATISSSPRNG